MKTFGIIAAIIGVAAGAYLTRVIVRDVAPDVRRYLRLRAM